MNYLSKDTLIRNNYYRNRSATKQFLKLFLGLLSSSAKRADIFGDAGLNGDRMRLDGADLTPTSGQKDANNVADSTATGAADVNSFGVDAKALAGATFASDQASLVASTTQDVFLVGVVTVSATG